MPGGIRTVSVSACIACPEPPQLRHARGRASPVPPQAVHARENTMCPRTVLTAPVPWHIAQAETPTAVSPRPSHTRHRPRRLTVR